MSVALIEDLAEQRRRDRLGLPAAFRRVLLLPSAPSLAHSAPAAVVQGVEWVNETSVSSATQSRFTLSDSLITLSQLITD